jgi:hypothetical protein
MKQKAIIVTGETGGTSRLDEYLDHGWKVVNSCPMPSSPSTGGYKSYTAPTCLVIVEGEKELT